MPRDCLRGLGFAALNQGLSPCAIRHGTCCDKDSDRQTMRIHVRGILVLLLLLLGRWPDNCRLLLPPGDELWHGSENFLPPLARPSGVSHDCHHV